MPQDDANAKALRLIAAAKAVPAGFDPGDYAQGEAWDAATAAQIIPQLSQLLSSEMYQQDPAGAACIQGCITGLAAFIQSEASDMADALAADAAEDVAQPDMPAMSPVMSIPNALKAISETDDELVVGNYIVLFGGRDLSGFDRIGATTPRYKNADGSVGERFAKTVNLESDYTALGRLPIDWEHGLYADEGEPGRHDLFGYVDWAHKSIDEKGVFVPRVLNRRAKYMEWVKTLLDAGMLGTSSEAIPEQIKSLKDGTITNWPLMRDTLTVAPAEYRNMGANVITALKALKLFPAEQKPGQAAPDGVPAAKSSAVETGDITMTPEELKALQDEQAANRKALADLTAQNTELLTELRKPALKTVLAQVEAAADKTPPFKNIAEQAYFARDLAMGVATEGQKNRQRAVVAHAVKHLGYKATGADELISSEGGALVWSDHANDIFQRAYSTGAVTSRCAKQTIGAGFNGTKIPAVDEQSRADGSRWGGIQAYWLNEAGAKIKSKPTWRLVVLELKKLIALVYATDELNEDAVGFNSFLMRTLPLEIAFKMDDAVLNGLGGGMPVGIVPALATVSVAKENNQAAASLVWENIKKMRARMWAPSRANSVWFINQEVEPFLHSMVQTVGVGGVAVYLPATGASQLPYDTLYGRPIIPIEQCQALGTPGDVIYADMSQYVLADKGGIDAQQSIHVAFTTDEMTYRWVYRADGAPLWNTKLTPAHGSSTLSPFVTLATRA